MADAEDQERDESPPRRPPLSDEQRWRLECFVELGFMADDALALAVAAAEHGAVGRALARGCTHQQAVRIFG